MEIFRSVTRDIFGIGLVAFVAFFVADLVKPGFATNYINLNALLLFVILSGIVMVLISKNKELGIKNYGSCSYSDLDTHDS